MEERNVNGFFNEYQKIPRISLSKLNMLIFVINNNQNVLITKKCCALFSLKSIKKVIFFRHWLIEENFEQKFQKLLL